MGEDSMSEEELIKRLERHNTTGYSYEDILRTLHKRVKLAAVLVPLSIHNGEVHVLLTLRSAKLYHHGGEVAFPGGKRDESEDEIQTCLRETEEEINLSPSLVKILAKTPPRATRHGFVFIPIVGLIPSDFKGKRNEDEVDAIFSVPLARFLSTEGHSHQEFRPPPGIRTFHVNSFEDKVDGTLFRTFGLTANICIDVAIALFQRKPEFSYEDHNLDVQKPFKHQEIYLRDAISLSKL